MKEIIEGKSQVCKGATCHRTLKQHIPDLLEIDGVNPYMGICNNIGNIIKKKGAVEGMTISKKYDQEEKRDHSSVFVPFAKLQETIESKKRLTRR